MLVIMRLLNTQKRAIVGIIDKIKPAKYTGKFAARTALSLYSNSPDAKVGKLGIYKIIV